MCIRQVNISQYGLLWEKTYFNNRMSCLDRNRCKTIVYLNLNEHICTSRFETYNILGNMSVFELTDIALHTLERVATDISKINNMEKHFENVKEKYKGNNIELESLENVLCDMASNPDLRLEQDLFMSLY